VAPHWIGIVARKLAPHLGRIESRDPMYRVSRTRAVELKPRVRRDFVRPVNYIAVAARRTGIACGAERRFDSNR